MPRHRNTDTQGQAFGDTTVEQVWGKGRPVPDYDSAVWRYDVCGMPLKRSEYGNTNSKNGWETDHIKPVAKGGSDEVSNLQPLQWELNRDKSDAYPWTCPKRS